MRYRTTLVLAIACLVTGCFIWIVERGIMRPHAGRDEKKWLLDLEPERASRVAFYRDGALLVECVNERGQWFVSRPVRDRADNSTVHRILEIATTLPVKDVITLSARELRGLTPRDYGLAGLRPRVVLEAEGRRRELAIGGVSPLSDAVYVLLDGGGRIIATSMNALELVPGSADDIRDRRLWHGSPSHATRIEIKRNDKPTLLMEKDGGEWIMRRPFIARADGIKVSGLLDRLFAMRIRQFVSDAVGDPVVYGVGYDDAIVRIGLWRMDQPEGETVLFGKAAGPDRETVYASRRDASFVYAVDTLEVESIGATAGDFSDSRLYFMPAGRAGFVEVKKGDQILRLHRGGDGKWNIVMPYQWTADEKVVSDLLNRLNAMRIVAFIEGPAINLEELGLAEPAFVIRVAEHMPDSESATRNTGQSSAPVAGKTRTLRISGARPGDERVYAKFDDQQHAYQVSAAAAMTISADPLKYRNPMALTLEPSEVSVITLRKNGVEYSVRRDAAGAWKPAAPDSDRADREAIRGILSAVASLEVSRFESCDVSNLAVYGLHAPEIVLTLGLTGEIGIRRSLLIGSVSDDGGFYAMLQGQDVVFVLDQETVAILTRGPSR